jgi:tagatose-1,6-bisphosphate aldolase non-catalytic subunit AgaZ/GatZ
MAPLWVVGIAGLRPRPLRGRLRRNAAFERVLGVVVQPGVEFGDGNDRSDELGRRFARSFSFSERIRYYRPQVEAALARLAI